MPEEKKFHKPPVPPTPPVAPLVECIITTKVYDACRQQECEFFIFENDQIDVPSYDDINDLTSFAEVVPNSVEYDVINITQLNGGPLARVQIEVCADINLFITNTETDEETVNTNLEVCFEKDVILYMPEPDRMEAIAEAIFQIAGTPVIEEYEDAKGTQVRVLVPIGAFIILKSTAEVQLLIPAFGFCPTPPVCEEFPFVDECEEFQQLPFPVFYPPQAD